MAGPEADIEQDVCDYASDNRLEHRKLAWIGRRDAPDRIFWGDDVPIFMIEFKAPGETLSPGQAREIEKLRRSGTRVHVCSNAEIGKILIDMELRHAAALDAY